ncbi:dTMP kinase [Sinobacterium caligoides]|nr:dTMP kinase [Sinobacterium caligoides]
MTNRKPFFITVEGGEGVGKTTNVAFIRQFLQHHEINHLHTREPGGTPLAEELREILLATRDESVGEMAELLMVFAARAQHLQQKILPALSSGKTVLCDRFTDATYAYQGCGRGLSIERIEQLEAMVQAGMQPDLTILLDLPVETGMARARARGELDRFESEHLAFFERVRAGYLARAAAEPERFSIIDASQDIASVQLQIESALLSFFSINIKHD